MKFRQRRRSSPNWHRRERYCHVRCLAAERADTAIFYSISNCQEGLRGISFGNFLIKQVVEELQAELPRLKRFSTLSPVPGLRRAALALLDLPVPPAPWLAPEERETLMRAAGIAADPTPDPARDADLLKTILETRNWWNDVSLAGALRAPLLRFAALYLTGGFKASELREVSRPEPVARFHLGNGARLERINWLGNPSARGIAESFGVMVNYLYDPDAIEARHAILIEAHEGFVAALGCPIHIKDKFNAVSDGETP